MAPTTLTQPKACSATSRGNTISSFKSYGQTHDPYSLAPAGPEAVGQGATAQNTQAQTAGVDQDNLSKQANLRGRIALGYMQSASKASSQAEQDLAWHTAVGQAHAAGLIPPLTAGHAVDNITDANQRMTIARQWAAAGADSVVNSGDSMGNQTREKNLNDVFQVPVGTGLYAGPNLKNAMFNSTPAASQTPNVGRSVATEGPAPVAPAPGNGSRPIAGGFLGASQASPGWIDQATPEQMRQGPGAPSAQPTLMTQAENAYGLPTNYLGRTAQIESGGWANASNPSGAAGLFQFVPSTWAKYGAPGASPLNPQAATVAAARLAADNSATLTKALGRPPTGAEFYLAHQQGAGGAAALLANPNAPAASLVGARAVVSNGGTPNMTAGQFAGMWERKFNGQGGGNFSLSGPSPMGQGVSMPPPEPASTLPGAGGIGLRAAAADLPQAPAKPDLAPPVPGPIPLPTSTQPLPTAPQASVEGRSASNAPSAPPTRSPAQGLTPLVSGLTPFQFEKQHLDAQRAVEEEKSARDQFVTASAAQTGLMQLQEDLSKLTPGPNANLRDTLLAPGSGADTRIGFAKAVNTALSTAGMPPLFEPEKITAAESAAKTTGRLGFDLAGGLGKGEAGYIVNQAIGLNPSVMSTPQGAKLLIGSLMASQQRQKDLYTFQQQYAENNGGNPIGAEVLFDQNHSPSRYVEEARSLARVPPAAVKLLQQNGNSQGMISAFNAKYGQGIARYYLGSRTD